MNSWIVCPKLDSGGKGASICNPKPLLTRNRRDRFQLRECCGGITMESPRPISFSAWLAHRRLSHHTVRLYSRRAEQFIEFATRNHASLESIARDTEQWEGLLSRFLASLQSSQNGIASGLKQVRAALGYLRDYLLRSD